VAGRTGDLDHQTLDTLAGVLGRPLALQAACLRPMGQPGRALSTRIRIPRVPDISRRPDAGTTDLSLPGRRLMNISLQAAIAATEELLEQVLSYREGAGRD
jgi:hypothetical protein